MRIMFDTNVLISAILFCGESLNRLIEKVKVEKPHFRTHSSLNSPK